MLFANKLQVIRRSKGMTQEELAEKLQVSRQAVAKWESGMAYPDISNLIQISELFHMTIDYLVKNDECSKAVTPSEYNDKEALIKFRLEANQNAYAANGKECEPSRLGSHDYSYEDEAYTYYDTWLGGAKFAGEEAIWKEEEAVYAMNYFGRVLDERFSGNFLKEALRAATEKLPYRGPEFYQAGAYSYKTKVVGDIGLFQGYEEIYYQDIKVYECYYHGGLL